MTIAPRPFALSEARAPGHRRRALLAALALALPAAPPAGAAAAAPAPEIVARVNGRPILRRDFDLAVQLQFQARAADAVGIEELRLVREKVLEQLIDNELLHQQALKRGGRVPESEVDAEVKRLKEGFASPDELSGTLLDSQVSEGEFREQVRRSLVVSRFVDEEVVGPLAIGDEDLRRYYEQNPSEVSRPEAVRIAQILVRVAADASLPAKAAARQKIEEILRELRAGRDFAEMARRHSEGPEAARGGDSGILPRGGGPPPIERAAFQMKPGEISDVIETRLGFHIIRVGGRRAGGPAPLEEIRDALRARVAKREREQAIRAFVQKLREDAQVERHLPAVPPGGPTR
jgi:peptidyl-prolyl cis-trans isomerase C